MQGLRPSSDSEISKKLSALDCFIVHVNHASLLIKSDGHYILTDPWFISPAFSCWSQRPQPMPDMIEYILNIDPSKLAVVISHGHDDHIDDFFLKKHLAAATYFYPEFASPGLGNRVKAISSHPPIGIGTGKRWNSFALNQLVNQDFTQFDAIVTIQSDDFDIIHANDNWHEQPKEVISRLNELVKSDSGKSRYYFSQVGIADPFPMAYPQFSLLESKSMVSDRVEKIIQATLRNMAAMGFKKIYAYANQAMIISETVDPTLKSYDLAKELIGQHGEIIQLEPGYLVTEEKSYSDQQIDDFKFTDRLIQSLENKANAYLKKCNVNDCKIVFEVIPNHHAPKEALTTKTAYYAASLIHWQNMLTGKVNLESIAIGGCGQIYKYPKEWNMRDVHNSMSKFAYIAQSMLNNEGLRWLL